MEKEEENTALAGKGKVKKGPNHGQNSKGEKKDLFKVKRFGCGDFGHYVTQCPEREKDKKGQQQTASSTEIDELTSRLEEFALIAAVPPDGGGT